MSTIAAGESSSEARGDLKTSFFRSGPIWVLCIAGIELAAQLLTAFRYGIFRDELYFIDCSKHLAWGYVDQPPLIALIGWIEMHVSGASLLSLRFLPAVAGGVTVWLAGKMARSFGGGAFGQALAALAVLIAPGYLAFFHLLTMNAFEPVIWTLCALIVLRIIQTGDQKLWLWFGLAAGIGVENKYGMVFFGLGILTGLLLTRERRALAMRWIWLAAGIIFLFGLPNFLWNYFHQWPFLQLMHNVRASGRDVGLNPLSFIAGETIFMNPVTAPIWMGGLAWLFFGRDRSATAAEPGRGRYRVLGWAFLVMSLLFIILKGKAYYVWPGFVMLFGAGGVAVESLLNHWSACWTKRVYVAAMILGGAYLAPLTLPVLPPYTFIGYVKKTHLPIPQVEHQPNGPLGQQIYADMFGWKEMAQKVAKAYNELPPDIRAKTAIAAGDYGEAGAIDYFGPKYGLPAAISGHQSYWFWGPRNYTGESMLLLNSSPSRVKQLCDQWQVVGQADDPLSRADEHFDIYWCRQHRWTLQQIWPQAKHWN
jgi:dolichyl-phosphate-mannose-protein mannosyltransferase